MFSHFLFLGWHSTLQSNAVSLHTQRALVAHFAEHSQNSLFFTFSPAASVSLFFDCLLEVTGTRIKMNVQEVPMPVLQMKSHGKLPKFQLGKFKKRGVITFPKLNIWWCAGHFPSLTTFYNFEGSPYSLLLLLLYRFFSVMPCT